MANISYYGYDIGIKGQGQIYKNSVLRLQAFNLLIVIDHILHM